MSRLLPESAYGSLKTATALAFQRSEGGSAEAFAKLTRVTPRSLRKYADHESALYLPLDVAADLDADLDTPLIASALAQLSGHVLMKPHVDAHARALDVIKQTSEATAIIAALSLEKSGSGAWGLDTAKAALAEVREAIAALAGLEADLQTRVEGKAR